jgi:hypothetical protein
MCNAFLGGGSSFENKAIIRKWRLPPRTKKPKIIKAHLDLSTVQNIKNIIVIAKNIG